MTATNHTIDVASLTDDRGYLMGIQSPYRIPIPNGHRVVVELTRNDGELEPRAVRLDNDCLFKAIGGYEDDANKPDKIVRGTYNADNHTVSDLVVL